MQSITTPPCLQIRADFLKQLADNLANPEALLTELDLMTIMLSVDPSRAKDAQSYLVGWISCCLGHGILKAKAAENPVN